MVAGSKDPEKRYLEAKGEMGGQRQGEGRGGVGRVDAYDPTTSDRAFGLDLTDTIECHGVLVRNTSIYQLLRSAPLLSVPREKVQDTRIGVH